MARSWRRSLALVLVLALGAFLVLMALAAAAYPGGTYCEPNADRYRFWGNYFCDLTAPVTARGESNAHSAAFAEAAFVSFGVAEAPFFWLLGLMAKHARAIRALGLWAALATVALAWLPSHAGPTLHAFAVFSATIPGLAAAALGTYWLNTRTLAPRSRLVARLGAATFAAGFADAAGYAYAVATDAACLPWLPAVQKGVAVLLVLWMLATAAVAMRAG